VVRVGVGSVERHSRSDQGSFEKRVGHCLMEAGIDQDWLIEIG
jgi:hypothetical protein